MNACARRLLEMYSLLPVLYAVLKSRSSPHKGGWKWSVSSGGSTAEELLDGGVALMPCCVMATCTSCIV